MRRVVALLLVASALGFSVLIMGCRESAKAASVPLEEVPPELVKKAQETLPEVKFDHARRLPNGDYEIRGKGKNGKVREVELKPSGEIVEIE